MVSGHLSNQYHNMSVNNRVHNLHFFFRSIVLQNESVDDGIEHFEDIVENPEDPAIASTTPNKQDVMLASLEKYNSDAEDGSDTTKQAKGGAGDEKGQINASADGPTSHILYNPRHREPSYWYCLFNPLFCMIVSDYFV